MPACMYVCVICHDSKYVQGIHSTSIMIQFDLVLNMVFKTLVDIKGLVVNCGKLQSCSLKSC